VLLILCCFFPALLLAQKTLIKRFTSEQGLSQNTVNAIIEDSRGFIWIATNDGLNRFDGYEFKVINTTPGSKQGLKSNSIISLAKDNYENIWIGSKLGGLASYNLLSGEIKSFSDLDGFPKGFEHTTVYDLFISDDDIWIATSDFGLLKYNIITKKISEFSPTTSKSIVNEQVITVAVNSDGKICFGDQYGRVYLLNPETSDIKLFKVSPTIVTSIISDGNNGFYVATGEYGIWKISAEGELSNFSERLSATIKNKVRFSVNLLLNDNALWISGSLYGLMRLDLQTLSLESIPLSHTAIDDYSTTNPSALFFDEMGSLWVGTNGYGLSLLTTNKKSLSTVSWKNKKNVNFSVKSIRSLYEYKDILLIGGYFGLQKFNRITGEIKTIMAGEVPYDIQHFEDEPDDIVWISFESMPSRVMRFNITTGARETYNFPPLPLGGGVVRPVYTMQKDRNGIIWLGGYFGLFSFDPKTKMFKDIFYSTHPNKGRRELELIVGLVYDDENNRLWVATETNGLFSYYPDKDSLVKEKLNLPKTYDNSALKITGIVDNIDEIIIATSGLGMILMNKDGGVSKVVTTSEGLSNNVTYGVLIDSKNNYWISTNWGITIWNRNQNAFSYLDMSDGLTNNEFNRNAFVLGNSGIMYFGGIDGVTYFLPEEIRFSQVSPRLYLVGVEINSSPYESKKMVEYIDTIETDYEGRFIQLKIAGLHYAFSDQLQYEYRIDGVSDNWIRLGTNRTISIATVHPGEYTIRVRVLNEDGYVSPQEMQIALIINPPFWETTIFRFLIVLMLAVLVVGNVKYRSGLAKSRRRDLEEEVEKRTKEIITQQALLEEQKNQILISNEKLSYELAAKDKFFAIIAHDLKNPFSSLIGFSEILDEEYHDLTEEERIEYIKIIRSVSKSSLDLLLNLLEWARLQTGKISFEPTRVNLSELIENELILLSNSAFEKNVTINHSINDSIVYNMDPFMMSTVLRNLVSNAIKFTPSGGIIYISTMESETEVRIYVTDTGVGISQERIGKLFKVDSSFSTKGTNNESGTGLGLILCKEFIEKHDGLIEVESTVGKGTTFLIHLPK